MAIRKNLHTLDNSGIYQSGNITKCRFSSSGLTLAVSDRGGNICFYQNNGLKSPVYLGQFPTFNNQSCSCKHPFSIHAIEQIPRTQFQSFVTADEASIKIWKYDDSRPLDLNKTVSKKQNSEILSSCFILKPTLKSEINLPSVSIDMSRSGDLIVCQDGHSLTLINFEDGEPLYTFAPSLSFRPALARQLSKQSKLDYSERVHAEIQFWNQINSITKVKFHNTFNNRLGYSDKLGQMHYLDTRLPQNSSQVLKLEVPRGKSTVECCLNVLSDFTFLENGNQILTRDFLYVYKWDMKYPKTYLSRESVYPQVNSQICDLYQEGQIYNQFMLRSNPSGSKIFTTHFEQSFHEIDVSLGTNYRYKETDNESNVEKINELTLNSMINSQSLHQSMTLQCFDYHPNTDVVCTAIGQTIRLFSQN